VKIDGLVVFNTFKLKFGNGEYVGVSAICWQGRRNRLIKYSYASGDLSILPAARSGESEGFCAGHSNSSKHWDHNPEQSSNLLQ